MSHAVGGVALEATTGVDLDTNSHGIAWEAWFYGDSEAIKEGGGSGFGKAENGTVVGKDKDEPQRKNGVRFCILDSACNVVSPWHFLRCRQPLAVAAMFVRLLPHDATWRRAVLASVWRSEKGCGIVWHCCRHRFAMGDSCFGALLSASFGVLWPPSTGE